MRDPAAPRGEWIVLLIMWVIVMVLVVTFLG